METTLPRAARRRRDPDETLKLARAGASAERCVRTFLALLTSMWVKRAPRRAAAG